MCMCFRMFFGLVFFGLLSWNLLGEEIKDHKVAPKEYTLQKSYIVHSSQIYSTMLFPEISKNFKIAVLPEEKFSITLKSYEVVGIFERNGFILHTPHSEVEFIYQAPMPFDKPKEFIKRHYVEFYEQNCPQSLVISDVIIESTQDIDLENASLAFFKKNSAFKNARGTLIVNIQTNTKSTQGKKNQKIFLPYTIKGQIKGFETTQNIRPGEDFNQNNTKAVEFEFDKITSMPACESEVFFSSARTYLGNKTIVSKDKLRKALLVKKGEIVLVNTQTQGISVQNTFEAMQSGGFGEVINAKNVNSGRIVKIKITQKNQGTIL